MTREEAITIIDNLHLIGCGRNQHEDDLKTNVALDMAIEALRDKPKGKWIIEDVEDLWDGLTNLTCPTCGKKYNAVPFIYNYCPNCGAKMGDTK